MPPRRYSFHETINGRNYRIEVTAVHSGRWRAEVVTQYGGPTALMPFYDASPDGAREGLLAWLSQVQPAGAGR